MAWNSTFGTEPSTNHNDLAELQGGTTDEYYHFTLAQYTALLALI